MANKYKEKSLNEITVGTDKITRQFLLEFGGLEAVGDEWEIWRYNNNLYKCVWYTPHVRFGLCSGWLILKYGVLGTFLKPLTPER